MAVDAVLTVFINKPSEIKKKPTTAIMLFLLVVDATDAAAVLLLLNRMESVRMIAC